MDRSEHELLALFQVFFVFVFVFQAIWEGSVRTDGDGTKETGSIGRAIGELIDTD